MQLVNSEVFYWLVAAVAVCYLVVKIFPDLMEGTK